LLACSSILPAAILGTLAEWAPAPLPVPDQPPAGLPVYRIDDRGQGLLFRT
jgi:hypothetical protein